ncbi:MAG TPA: hypothetical protein VNH11_13790 [Pirellulales bacterium]|nr:hypothetical protein [Pirellulales bacterium]
MKLPACLPVVLIATLHTLAVAARGDDVPPAAPPSCAFAVDNYFVEEVWTKVGAQKCLNCHKAGGDAEDSRFVLRDPQRVTGNERRAVLEHNRDAFTRMAQLTEGGTSRLLVKMTGGLDHGGQVVLPADTSGYRILADFVSRGTRPADGSAADARDSKAPPFFQGITMLDDRRHLRRATLSLVGRLPASAELETIQQQGLPALPGLLNKMFEEEAFYERLREGFNDIFLTIGITGNPDQVVLAYEHFTNTRQWYAKHDLSHIQDEAERRKAGYKLADDYRHALLAEPMQLVDYIVRHDRPFTEIVTADYILVSPFSARGYGIYDEIKDRFQDPDNPHEFIPVKLKALVGRSRSTDQESATGFYPHAGLLSTFQYLVRYPTTETNRNRLRARMYYQHFLGIDALELAARVSDAAAVTAKYEIPTMQAAECVVCHKTVDPVAGLFQDYWQFADGLGVYGRRKEGWFKDMFAAGFEGEDLPADERWRALQWLGERTAKDPRFAVAMVEHVYYILTGRKVLLPSKAIDDPLYPARQRAYREQRREIERIAADFAETNFNLKRVFQDWIMSDFYRADGLESAASGPCRLAELDDLGLVRMLAPEQLDRKLKAVFGESWGKLDGQLAMLYGGIDSKEVTERASDPSGAMGAIQRIMSNDVACKQTARDFARPMHERLLFPAIEPAVVPGESHEGDQALRKAMAYLHERILGRYDPVDSPEVTRTFDLFAGVVHDAAEQRGLDKLERWACRQGSPTPPEDPHYTVRAWRAVVTYLLRRQEFLYE